MRSLIVLILLLLVAAAPRAAEREAAIIVAPDSTVFEIPLESPDDVWEISFPVFERMGWEKDGAVALSMHTWSGTGYYDSTLQSHDEATLAWADDSCQSRASVTPVLSDGVLRCKFGRMEDMIRLRPIVASLHVSRADGSTYEQPVRVVHIPDPRADIARSLAGTLTADECMIYQLVLDRAITPDVQRVEFSSASPRTGQPVPDQPPPPHYAVVTPTIERGPLPWEAERLGPRGADPDCVANYLENRAVAVDLSSLAPLGYHMMERDALETALKEGSGSERKMRRLEVSRVGFNDTRDQALVFLSWAERGWSGFEIVRLDKLDGEWLVTRRLRP
ncbi:MAG TPA: hypothetical protein VFX92_00720 [Candidatus Krumholzibacteria bacterium]|nr:hypothetical protein [Candidatus Krumholzibacteria bacterium]